MMLSQVDGTALLPMGLLPGRQCGFERQKEEETIQGCWMRLALGSVEVQLQVQTGRWPRRSGDHQL